jgi:TolB protein
MVRSAALTGMTLGILACGGDAGPARTVLYEEPTAELIGSTRLSPEGTRFAFGAEIEGRSGIFVMNADGTGRTRLTSGVWDVDPHWSPDGQWLAYYSDEDADVWVVPSAGGEPRQLTSGTPNDFPRGWTPDGTGVIIQRSTGSVNQTMIVPLAGGAPRPIIERGEASVTAALSPDGSQVAWLEQRQGQSTLWTRTLPDGAPRQLTTDGREFYNSEGPWSPDGRFFLYGTTRSGTADLWVVEVATGEQRQLTTDLRDDNGGRWSPDGAWIAFTSTRGGQRDVWVMPSAGGAATRATNDLTYEHNVEWAPDGSAITFHVHPSRSELVVLAMDGTVRRTLLSWEGYSIQMPVASPDGRTILFVSDRSGGTDIWAISDTGGDPRPFAASPTDDFAAQWSPDGRQVVFVSERTGGRANLYVTSDTGGTARALTDWSEGAAAPEWSPDGQTVAFLSPRGAARGREIWTVPATGGEAVQVTRDGNQPFGHVWSPDGQSLYYGATRASNDGQDLFRIPARGGRARPLGIPRGSSVSGPRVSPDGEWVAYATYPAGWGYIEVVPAQGGTPRRLSADTADVYQGGARWLPDGSGLLFWDYHYPSSSIDLSIYTWPAGERRPVTQTPGIQEGAFDWMPDRQSVIAARSESSGLLVAVQMADVLPSR